MMQLKDLLYMNSQACTVHASQGRYEQGLQAYKTRASDLHNMPQAQEFLYSST